MPLLSKATPWFANMAIDQIVTNFRQSETDTDKISCWRYLTAHKLLTDCQGDKQHCLKNILEATHQEGRSPHPLFQHL
jgi:hypothetical protein